MSYDTFYFSVRFFKILYVFYTHSMFQRGLTTFQVFISYEWLVAAILYCTERGRVGGRK